MTCGLCKKGGKKRYDPPITDSVRFQRGETTREGQISIEFVGGRTSRTTSSIRFAADKCNPTDLNWSYLPSRVEPELSLLLKFTEWLQLLDDERCTPYRRGTERYISNSRTMRTVDWSSFDRADKTERRFENGISLTSTTNGWEDAWGTVKRSSVRVYRVYEWACEESEEGLQGEKQLAVEDSFRLVTAAKV